MEKKGGPNDPSDLIVCVVFFFCNSIFLDIIVLVSSQHSVALKCIISLGFLESFVASLIRCPVL